MTPAVELAQPVEPRVRIEIIDVVRGFAVVGLILANMPFYSSAVFYTGLTASLETLDGIAILLIQLFAQGKIYALFSFLFGVGIALQYARRSQAARELAPLHARRMIVLALLGGVHLTLIWYGDILLAYAVLGTLLFPFRRWPSAVILGVAALCVFSPMIIRTVQTRAGAAPPAPQARQERPSAETPAQQATRIYASGTVREITAQRMRDVRARMPGLLQALPHMFAMVLTGLYVGRRRIFENVDAHRTWIRRVFWWCLILGLACNLFSVGIRLFLTPRHSAAWLFAQATFYAGAPTLAFAYASGLVLLARREWARRALLVLAPLGRMALTNYLLQSVICTTIFYGYGLGLYGSVGAASALALSVVILCLQLYLSRLWLAHFRFGPVEWLWRLGTYGRAAAADRPMIVSPVQFN